MRADPLYSNISQDKTDCRNRQQYILTSLWCESVILVYELHTLWPLLEGLV